MSKKEFLEVLILVLVEHTLGVGEEAEREEAGSLNPCFSGTYSRSCKESSHCPNRHQS